MDGLRFLSIALIILYHAPYYELPGAPAGYRAFASHGSFGVQMFFVVSGFILGLPFAEANLYGGHKINLRRYFGRRLTRLEPPYLINLILWFSIKTLLLGRSFAWLFPHLLASATYTHNAIYGAPSEVNFYAWSLEVEVQFYIVAPLVGLVFRLGRRARLSLLGAGILGASLIPGALSLATQAQWFLLGFVLVDIYLVSWSKKPPTSLVWDAVALVAWPLVFIVQIVKCTVPYAQVLLLPWILLTAYVTAFRGVLVRRLLRWEPVYIIGGMCYSIYLYHGYVLEAVLSIQRRYLTTGQYYVDTAIGLCSIAVAVVFSSSLAFVAFEKPFMNPRWPIELWRQVAGPAEGPAVGPSES